MSAAGAGVVGKGEARTEAPTVLLLEDEPMILMDLAFALADEGVRALEARDVEGAIGLIGRERPDAAVLDVNLGGGETCERVAERLREEGVPFVLHSGDLDRQGEFIAAIDAEIVPKPTPAHLVVRRAIALID